MRVYRGDSRITHKKDKTTALQKEVPLQTVEKVLSAVILSVVETRRARVRGSRGGKSVNFRRFSGGASPSPTNLCEFRFPA